MVTSVAIYFIKPEYAIAKFNSVQFYKNNPKHDGFKGYIDESFGDFVLVDEKQGLYRRTVYSQLEEYDSKPLSEIDYETIFEQCVFADPDYKDNLEHKDKWLNIFRDADKSLILYIEFH